MKRSHILLALALIVGLSLFPGFLGINDEADWPNIYIDASAGSGGDGSSASPYDEFSDINWTTGGDNSVYDGVAAGQDVTINLKCGEEWRETMTPGASGVAAHGITLGKYGTGDDPIINGSDLVTTWTESLGVELVANGTFDSGVVSWNAYNATIDYEAGPIGGRSNVAKITITATGYPQTNQTCYTAEKHYSASSMYYIPSGNTSLDNIMVHQGSGSVTQIGDTLAAINTWTSSGAIRFTATAGNTKIYFYGADGGVRSPAGTIGDVFYIDDVSVKEGATNVWKATLTTEPSKVFLDGVWGNKQTALEDVDSTNDWYWEANVLYVYSTTDHDSAFTSPGIEAVVRDYGIDTNDTDYLTIEHIGFKNTEEAAILINESNHLIIQSCDIVKSWKDGVRFSASTGADNNIIRYCKIQDNRRYGVYWAADANKSEDNQLYYNLIYGNYGDGIRADNDQSGNLIYNNDIEANLRNGAYFIGVEGFTLKNNIINGNRFYELRADATSDITHSNNAYHRSDRATTFVFTTLTDNITYNGTGYNRGEIASGFEATAVVNNPLPESETPLSVSVDGVAIAADGTTVYAYSTSIGASGIYKSIDSGTNWTLSRAHTGGLMVFIDSRGYVYTSPYGDVDAADMGLFRSIDSGANWTRVLDLSSFAQKIGVWAIAEDSNGHIYAGLYNDKADAGHIAKIYKSTNSGASFSEVYSSATYDHIHGLAVDTSNDYVYATLGDGVVAIIRSVDGGANWTEIFSDVPQCVAVYATSAYRLFGIDAGASTVAIYKTTDDATWETVYEGEDDGFVFWFQSDGTRIYAGTTYSNTTHKGAILVSEDDGATWQVRKAVPNGASWSGTPRASNIVDGKFIYNSYEGNAVLLYTDKEDDFVLPSTSPCIDAGVDVSLTSDYVSSTVPQIGGPSTGKLFISMGEKLSMIAGSASEGSPDIGAYEYYSPLKMKDGHIYIRLSETLYFKLR